jgi:aryl-alcohol dehydrogenase-like predicted oxidoreductase
MHYRTFGRTGWQVSEIGYGMWGMGGWTGSDDQESLRSLERALTLGCNFFDTAWVYGLGRSEKLLGEALRAWRRPVRRSVSEAGSREAAEAKADEAFSSPPRCPRRT